MDISCTLNKVLRCEIYLEDTEHYIIGHEPCVVHIAYGIDGYAIAPYSIGANCRSYMRFNNLRMECNGFAFLVKKEVLIGICEGIDTVFSRCNTFNGEASAGIGTGYALKWQLVESAVIKT